MKWDELSAPEFEKAVIACKGVCVVPIGVIEKHGDHLPLGTDMFEAGEVAKLGVLRDDRKLEFKVTLARRDRLFQEQ